MKTKLLIFLTIFLAFYANLNAQFKQKSNGYIGIGTVNPVEQFQIGDRWTFHNGGTKIIGYNYGHNGSDYKIVSAHSSLLKFDSDGDIVFAVSAYGSAGSIITNWKFPLEIKNNGNLIFHGSGCDLLIERLGSSIVMKPQYNNWGYLGTSENYWGLLYCNNIFYKGSIIKIYDQNVKEDVQPIENALSKINSLKGISYKLEGSKHKSTNCPSQTELVNQCDKDLGFSAQELKEVVPEAVVYNSESGLYGIDYIKLVPLLVEAIKEQQVQINELKSTIEKIELNNYSLNSTVFPNPISLQASIDISIPSHTKKATINIYCSDGKLIKKINIGNRGNSTITFDTSDLSTGIYIFSLIADGNVIFSNKMIKQ